jgi:NAD-dependent SIR2 family protein deacetylase
MYGYGNNYYNIFDLNNYFRDEEESKLLHLHGSYKFFIYFGDFIKVKKDGWNFYRENKEMLIPVLIFNAPKFKEKQIKSFAVLNVYFHAFKEELKKSKNLIIWGQSLKNDPHIENVIKKLFIDSKVKEKRLIIVDNEKKHKIQENCKDLTPIFINPENFQNLKDLMHEIKKEMI